MSTVAARSKAVGMASSSASRSTLSGLAGAFSLHERSGQHGNRERTQLYATQVGNSSGTKQASVFQGLGAHLKHGLLALCMFMQNDWIKGFWQT